MHQRTLFRCVIIALVLAVIPVSTFAYYAEVSKFSQYDNAHMWTAKGPFSYTYYHLSSPSHIRVDLLGNGLRFASDDPLVTYSSGEYAASGLFYAGDIYNHASFDAEWSLPSVLSLELWCYKGNYDIGYTNEAIMAWHATGVGQISADIPIVSSWKWEFRLTAVPEASSLAALLSGACGLAGFAWSTRGRTK